MNTKKCVENTFKSSPKQRDSNNSKENVSTTGPSPICLNKGNKDSNRVDGSQEKSGGNVDQGGGLPETSKDSNSVRIPTMMNLTMEGVEAVHNTRMG